MWIEYNQENKKALTWVNHIKEDIARLKAGDEGDKRIALGLEGFPLREESQSKERDDIMEKWAVFQPHEPK